MKEQLKNYSLKKEEKVIKPINNIDLPNAGVFFCKSTLKPLKILFSKWF